MPLYRIDMKVCATAYIRADGAAEALEEAKRLKDSVLEVEDVDSDVKISGLQLDHPDLPDISLSPAMTIHGPVGTPTLAE